MSHPNERPFVLREVTCNIAVTVSAHATREEAQHALEKHERDYKARNYPVPPLSIEDWTWTEEMLQEYFESRED